MRFTAFTQSGKKVELEFNSLKEALAANPGLKYVEEVKERK